MISEVALGLVSSALHEGLKHPVTAIKSAATRRAELGKALDGTSASNEQASRAAAALADLARVIAHRYNEYSERVDEFLSEIKRSAIPSTLTHLLMCSLSPDEIKPAFDCIYNTYTPLPFGADELFDAYCTAVRLRLEEAVKDKELLSILQAQVGDLRQRVDDVRRALSSADKLKTTLSYDQYRDAKLKLAKAVEAANRDVAVETDRGTKRVLINKIVISARLSLTDGEKIAVPSPDGSGDGQKLSLSDFKRSFYRAVVLGDPGGGKSTLTQLLCYDLAKRISVEAQNTKRPGFEPRDLLLPLKITLRSFDKKQKQDPSFTLIDHIVNELRVVLDNDPAFTEAFLLHAAGLQRLYPRREGARLAVSNVHDRQRLGDTRCNMLHLGADTAAKAAQRNLLWLGAVHPKSFDPYGPPPALQ
ncbi:hypothetical protein [Sinorhizobium alkalisoli]|uniref:hypothetical protein n=1 Tax=Sinorhizobium alkalisoli TaxID=1752398 RepID=UPI00124C8D8C|nr:hypothetical protein [Sinorhizobium alkalisoli]QFI65565.1 hypothetical protein EKH55_0691 [Sinorhizobium alkalisoli]